MRTTVVSRAHRAHRVGGPGAVPTRPTGGEFRLLAWLFRHPLIAATPPVLVAAVVRFGPAPVGAALAGLVVALAVWWRAHPPSYDRWAAPRIRTCLRRWWAYRGARWARLLGACELTREHRHSGHPIVPRVCRVRAVTPSIDTLRVRIIPGQDLKTWVERLPALADALGVHQIAATRHRPGVLALVIERRMPFTFVVPATRIPELPGEVDLGAVVIGEDEYGRPYTLRLRGKHFLGVGATGSGKSGLMWNPLRALGPMIRDRLVRVWMIDLKGGMETATARPLFHRWARTGPDAISVLTEFRDTMLARQDTLRQAGKRRSAITVETPYELLVIDELAMATAYGDRSLVREALRLLAEILTQGRAADCSVMAFVQEPSKDVVDVRDLFTTKICLGVTAAVHVDMALGDGARDKGALADEIPGDPEHAGIGFAIAPGSRLPVRLRAGLVADSDITELVATCAPGSTFADPDERRWGGTRRATHLIALPTPTDTDRTTDGTTSGNGEESAS
jgi:DNA segregation ATPase FtsK/SpoIIIE, S-DNA-T family